MTPEECLIIYGKAWFERDPQQRVEVLRACCTEDIVFMDSGLGRLEGLEAVSDMIGGSLAEMAGTPDGSPTESVGQERGRTGGGVSVEVVTPIDVRHGFFRYSFVWTLPDGSRSGGTDFCELATDGRMKLITVWARRRQLPAAEGLTATPLSGRWPTGGRSRRPARGAPWCRRPSTTIRA